MFLATLNFRNTPYVNFDPPSVHVIQRYYEWETLISRNAILVPHGSKAWNSQLHQWWTPWPERACWNRGYAVRDNCSSSSWGFIYCDWELSYSGGKDRRPSSTVRRTGGQSDKLPMICHFNNGFFRSHHTQEKFLTD